MSVTMKDVEYVAELARLSLNDQEKEKFTHQLNDILKYVEKLNELDTSSVEPLEHVTDFSDVTRDDEVTPSLSREEALRNAPDRTEKFFRVPSVRGDR